MRSSFPKSKESSAPSTAFRKAEGPPAINPMNCSGDAEKVGGHSAASHTPKRPEVPAPM